IEVRLLSRRETVDGCSHLGWGEAQVGHDGACSGNLALRNSAVRLRNVSHRAERRPEELLAYSSRVGIVAQPRVVRIGGIFIELVTQQHTDGGPDRPAREQPDSSAYDFSGEFHPLYRQWAEIACGNFSGHYSVDRRQKAWFLPATPRYSTKL